MACHTGFVSFSSLKNANKARVRVLCKTIMNCHRYDLWQVDSSQLGKLCSLIIPCALTALDHWSPEVKVGIKTCSSIS